MSHFHPPQHAHGSVSDCHDSHSGTRHSHPHSHVSPENAKGKLFFIATALNLIFVGIEFVYGFLADSAALMADAGHNLFDVLGLMLAWGAFLAGQRQPTGRYTYGFGSSSILAALANSGLVFIACGAIGWEAIHRFFTPSEVAGFTVSVVALVGIGVNGFSAWLFLKNSQEDINIRGAYLHMAADAAISLGVAVSGLLIAFTHWQWIDPLVSLLILGIIVASTWGLLREAVQLGLNGVPAQIDIEAIAQYLRHLEGVTDMYDLHIWGMSTTKNALTAYLIMPEGYPSDMFLEEVRHTLHRRFSIHHSTLQVQVTPTRYNVSH